MTQTLHDNRQPLTSTPDWPFDEIVGRLSALRRQSLEARNRLQKPTILPSREALARIVEKLALVLFPNRLGNRVLAPTSIDYFVGQLLDVTLNELLHQVEIEVKYSNPDEINDRIARDRAIESSTRSLKSFHKSESCWIKICKRLSRAILRPASWMRS